MAMSTLEPALRKKHGPIPSVAITAPPTDGPPIRAKFITTLFRVTAFRNSSAGTISVTNV
jgi:hypothetical protein